jgi:hypothetical protein
MVNCFDVKKYILSIVIGNFAVSVSQEVSNTKSKSRDLSRLVSIQYIIYFSNFAIDFKLLLYLSPRGARWSSGQLARRAIAEAKHRSQRAVLGWVTNIYYLELLRASKGTLVPVAFAIVSTHSSFKEG